MAATEAIESTVYSHKDPRDGLIYDGRPHRGGAPL